MAEREVVALVPLDDPAVPDPLAAIAAARQVSERVHAILLGATTPLALLEAARLAGATSLTVVTAPGLATPSTEAWLAAFAVLTPAAPALLVLPAGGVGEEIAARLAARLGGVALGRCRAVAMLGQALRITRPAYGGRAEAVLETTAPLVTVALRRPATAPAPAAELPVTRFTLDLALPAPEAVPLADAGSAQARLDGARLVVSGGRGMGGEEGFRLLGELAALLGAQVGASLPAVDAGWASVAQQVGQSGHFVAPALYLAVGMSGTAQHLAGLAPGTRIIAVNKDAEADIFRHAAAGLVAEWQEVLPGLLDQLRKE